MATIAVEPSVWFEITCTYNFRHVLRVCYVFVLFRVALMGVSSVFVKTPVHDGLSTTPMEYRIVQEHKAKVVRRARAPSRVPGVLVLSEAVSCLQALRGCLPVNPWQVEAVAEAMTRAVNASTREKLSWHEVGSWLDPGSAGNKKCC